MSITATANPIFRTNSCTDLNCKLPLSRKIKIYSFYVEYTILFTTFFFTLIYFTFTRYEFDRTGGSGTNHDTF